MNLQGQDWNSVVLRKKAPASSTAQSAAAVNAALQSGAAVSTVKKHDAGSNKARAGNPNAVKLDAETEDFHHEQVSSELKKQIQQARLAKKLSQAQLAQMINEKPQVINEYEAGKAIPNPQILGKLSRALGVTLRKNPGKK